MTMYRDEARTCTNPTFWSRFGPHKLARTLESCIPYLGPKAARESTLSRLLSIHIAMSPDLKGFRQDLINSQLSPSPATESCLGKTVPQKERPQVLLVEDNSINLKVSPLTAFLITILVSNWPSY
jgi:hypothetical protein